MTDAERERDDQYAKGAAIAMTAVVVLALILLVPLVLIGVSFGHDAAGTAGAVVGGAVPFALLAAIYGIYRLCLRYERNR
jgi:hypothetical protein